MVTQANNPVVTDDPWDTAMDAEARPQSNTFYGQCTVDIWYCVLQKGTGKVQFDPAQHALDARRTAVKISVSPLASSKAKFDVTRELIAESDDWAKIIKPSIRALNADLRGLNQKYVKAEVVPTGGTYKNKAGEEKQSTTIKFVAVFDSEAACESAAAAQFGGGGTPPVPAPVATDERATCAKFLKPLWTASGNDLTVFAAKIAGTTPLNKYFSLDSPEVQAVIAG